MAKAFNLTAQINLQGPVGIKPIVAQIKKELGAIKTDFKLNIDPSAVKKIANITTGVNNLTTAIERAKVSVGSLNVSLANLGASLNNIKSVSGVVNGNINKVASSTAKSAKASKQAATEIQAFGEAAGLALKRFAAFSVVSTSIYGLVNSVNDAISEFLVFDRELVRLSQVTGQNIGQFGVFSSSVQNIGNEVRRLSTSLGVSSQELIKVASTLAQAGLSGEDTRVALEALAKSSLAPSFENMNDTVEGSIALMNQFGISTSQLEGALGSINQVSAEFAVESDDIIKAIQRTGGVFATSSRGVSSGTKALNEFIAIFTSVRATTRESSETIATGLKTIFTRIQRSSTVDALEKLGIQLRDTQGRFIGGYKAVEALSKGLSGLDPRSEVFAEVVEELGGFRQIGKVIPLIQQFDTAQSALASAQRGTNSLTEASRLALFSLENQLRRTREEFLTLVADFAQSGTVKALTISTLGLAQGFIGVVGALKPLLPLLTTFATIKLAQKIPEFIGGGGQRGFLTGLFKNANETTQAPGAITRPGTANIVSQTTTIGLSDNTLAIRNLTTAIQNLTVTIQSRPIGRTGFASGGLVGGVGNRDTVPAMLTPGEFVIRKNAVQSIGVGNLQNINKYAAGGIVKKKGSELIQLYPSLNSVVDPESDYSANVESKSITSKNISLIGNMIKNKRQNMAIELWRNFELALSKAYGLFYDTSSGAYLDFPKKPGDAKFLKSGETNRRNDLRGNNNETMLAKLVGSGKYKPNGINNVAAYYPENPKQIAGIIEAYSSGANKNRSQYGSFKFATGGSVKDTVPALLTPGEFVIRKEAAQKLGSATLHKMNNADKLQGYNKGGFVGGSIVQKFAAGGDVEASIQRILMNIEPLVQEAEKIAFTKARGEGKQLQEAANIAKEAAKVATREAIKTARASISQRTGVDYTTEQAAEEKRLLSAAQKRMIGAIETGKDPSVKGTTELRRKPGYLTEESKKTKETTEKINDANDDVIISTNNFSDKLLSTGLIISNMLIPQLKSIADQYKVTSNALGLAAVEAVELGSSLALSSNFALQAVGASKQTIALATAAAGIGGAIGGGLQGFSSKTIEQALKVNSESLASFSRTLQQTQEAPTEQLKIDAALNLDKELTALGITTQNTINTISNTEVYEKLGSVINSSISTILAVNTSFLALVGAANTLTATKRAETVASTAKAATNVAPAVVGGLGGLGAAASTGGRAIGLLSRAVARFIPYVNAALIVFDVLVVAASAFSIFSTSSGRATEELNKFTDALEGSIKNGNNYSLANQRFTGVILQNYRQLQNNIKALPKSEQQERKLTAFGSIGKVNLEGQKVETSVFALSSQLNDFNLLLDQFLRTELATKGLNVGTEQSIADFNRSLVVGSQAQKDLSKVLQDTLTAKPNQKASEFERQIFLRALTKPLAPGVAPVTAAEAEAKFAKATTEEIKKVVTSYSAAFNELENATKEQALTFRQVRSATLNLLDILNRFGAGLQRLKTDTTNSFDDILYNFKRSTEENVPVRGDVSAGRAAQVLRNLPAYTGNEITKAMDVAMQNLGMIGQESEVKLSDGKDLKSYADQLKKNILAFRVAQTQIPQALREYAAQQERGGGLGIDTLKDTLREIISPLQLDDSTQNSFLNQLGDAVQKSTSGEGTLDIETLAGRIPEITKGLEVFKASAERTAEVLDIVQEKNQRVAEVANAMAVSLNKVTQLQIQRDQLRLNTESEINKALGKTTGLRQANAPFEAALTRLLESMSITGRAPKDIAAAIASKQAELLEAEKAGAPAEQQGILISEISNLTQALDMLASKNDKLTNALDDLRAVEEERKGVGSLFEEMIKASRDPLARADIQATIAAARRVEAGSTNIEDVIRTLDKFIPMLEKTGPQGPEQAANLRNRILTRTAEIGTKDTNNLIAKSVGKYLISLFSGQKTQQATQNARKEIAVSEAAFNEQIKIQTNNRRQLESDLNITLLTFNNNLKNILPSIIGEMTLFNNQLKALNEKNQAKIPKAPFDMSQVSKVVDRGLREYSKIRSGFTPGRAAMGGAGAPSMPFRNFSPIMERYFEKGTGPGIPKQTLELSIAEIEFLLNELSTTLGTKNKALYNELQIQLELIRQERKNREQAAAPTIPNPIINNQQVPQQSPSPQITPQPSLAPNIGGGAFNIPPETLRKNNQTVGVSNTTKLDFDYKDFITQFSRSFDVETTKFRNVIRDLSLAFPALQAPIDTFSKSVNKLIDGLNTINNSGGIKGPNIPEKVTIEVVFNEDLTIDTSRINNNDLLDQIGVVTKDAINKRIQELKLTGQ